MGAEVFVIISTRKNVAIIVVSGGRIFILSPDNPKSFQSSCPIPCQLEKKDARFKASDECLSVHSTLQTRSISSLDLGLTRSEL
eukprot:5731673-Pyramimonas_sp.AAC.1